jgi:hypothetical protein
MKELSQLRVDGRVLAPLTLEGQYVFNEFCWTRSATNYTRILRACSTFAASYQIRTAAAHICLFVCFIFSLYFPQNPLNQHCYYDCCDHTLSHTDLSRLVRASGLARKKQLQPHYPSRTIAPATIAPVAQFTIAPAAQ